MSCRPVRRSSCRWGEWAACRFCACALDLLAPIQEGCALLPLLGDGIPDNSRRWEASEVRTPSLPLYGLSRCCVCKFDDCVLKVSVGVLPAPAGVWGVSLAATPFALKLLAVCCGCFWWSSGSVKHCFGWRIEHWSSFRYCIIGAEWLPQSYVRCWWRAG